MAHAAAGPAGWACRLQRLAVPERQGAYTDTNAHLNYRACDGTQVYLLAGLAGSGASLLFSDAVTVGASGAIFGLLGVRPRS